MGPEEYTDEEYDQMPIELQYLDKDKKREPDFEVRTELLVSLLQVKHIYFYCFYSI